MELLVSKVGRMVVYVLHLEKFCQRNYNYTVRQRTNLLQLLCDEITLLYLQL